MSEPFIGEIRTFAGNFAPQGWALCDGQLLSMSEYEALYGLIGTMYGGDGVRTFALPDLRGRIPIHRGPGVPQGEAAGSETVTLTTTEMPDHNHTVVGSSGEAQQANPGWGLFSTSADPPAYASFDEDKTATLNEAVLGSTGGSEPHDNMQPFLCVSFIIALVGIFPTQS